jgi:hypothetical protein
MIVIAAATPTSAPAMSTNRRVRLTRQPQKSTGCCGSRAIVSDGSKKTSQLLDLLRATVIPYAIWRL